VYIFFYFYFFKTIFSPNRIPRIVVFNDAAAHRRHNEVLKNTDARNTFEWEINLNGRKTRTYVYNIMLLGTTRNNIIIPTVLARQS